MHTLHIICGPAGVGKSTYGRQLAAERKACLLDSDTVTEPVVRAGMQMSGKDPADRDSAVYRRAFRTPVYECLWQTAAENLSHTEVVIVGPLTGEIRNPEWKEELEERFQTEVEIIFVTCSETERKQRIIDRENPRDALKLDDWPAYLAGSDIRPPACPHRVHRT